MAVILAERYTDKQVKMLDALKDKSVVQKKAIEALNNEMRGENDFDKRAKIRHGISKHQDNLKAISTEMEEVMNARKEYDELIASAVETLHKAWEYEDKYGFKTDPRRLV